MPARQSQAQVAAAPHYTVHGQVGGRCTGALRVDAMEQAMEHSEQDPGPLTALTLSAPGTFTLHIPAHQTVTITALCDTDNNGVLDLSVDKLSNSSLPVGTTTAAVLLAFE